MIREGQIILLNFPQTEQVFWETAPGTRAEITARFL